MRALLVVFLFAVQMPFGFSQFYFSFSEKVIGADFSAFKPISDRGYPLMQSGIIQIRPGVKYIRPKYALEANLSYFLSKDFRTNRNTVIFGGSSTGYSDKEAKFNGYGIGISFKYYLTTWKKFKIASGVELGGRLYQLTYSITEESTGTFPPVLTGPYNVFSLKGYGAYQDISVGLERIYDLKKIALGIGFDVGYRFDEGKWALDGPIEVSKNIIFQNGFFFKIDLFLRRNATKASQKAPKHKQHRKKRRH